MPGHGDKAVSTPGADGARANDPHAPSRRELLTGAAHISYFIAILLIGRALLLWHPPGHSNWIEYKQLLDAGYLMIPLFAALGLKRAPRFCGLLILIWIVTYFVLAHLYAPMR